VQQPTAFRWPGVALLLLVIAASLLIAAMQCGVLARRYGPSADEVAARRQAQGGEPEADPDDDAFADAVALCAWWADCARWAFGLGIIALWTALGVAVMPLGGQEQTEWRWAAAAIAGGLAVLEIAWLVVARIRPELLSPLAAARRRYYG
jgi:hypothetical protein